MVSGTQNSMGQGSSPRNPCGHSNHDKLRAIQGNAFAHNLGVCGEPASPQLIAQQCHGVRSGRAAIRLDKRSAQYWAFPKYVKKIARGLCSH
jgi:hypothetical protein